jgi:hypothetical protein
MLPRLYRKILREMTYMTTIQEVSDQIASFIKSCPRQTCLGVHLGIFLKNTLPGFSPLHYQCRNLRQFIRVNVPEVFEAGRAGLDVRYGIGQPSATPATTASAVTAAPPLPPVGFVPLPVDPPVWKAFSNPGYPFALAINGDTGELETLPIDAPPSSPWVVIPKASTDTHFAIATEFTSSLPSQLQSVFRRTLADPRWYVHFSALAKQHGVGSQWAAFRRTKLIEVFQSSVRALGVSIAPRALRGPNHPVDRPVCSVGRTTSPAIDEAAFRGLVLRVIAELPIDELRLLRLPVGVVFDAFRK